MDIRSFCCLTTYFFVLLLLDFARPSSASSLTSSAALRHAKHPILLDFAKERKFLLAKYGNRHGHAKRQGVVQTNTTNQNTDILYYANVDIGTPPRSFAVALDTGSADLWLQTAKCAPCTGRRFDPNTSSSLVDSSTPFAITYGIGSVRGTVATDTISIGSGASTFTVQDQTLGLVNYTNGTPVPGNLAGFMGLGFKNLAMSQGMPFWEALVRSGRWAEPVMSFWMTRYNNVSEAEDAEFGGEFTMGGTNSALYVGEIEWSGLPQASNPGFWAISLAGISVNGRDTHLDQLAAIDTATSLIGGPSDAVRDLYATVPGATPGQGTLEGFWTYPCKQDVAISLNFGGGRVWPMAPADFALATRDPDVCVGAIFETTLGDDNAPQIPRWYIGASFLKNVYSVFRYDPPAVGFAQLSEVALQNKPVPLPPLHERARSSGDSIHGAVRPTLCKVLACYALFLTLGANIVLSGL